MKTFAKRFFMILALGLVAAAAYYIYDAFHEKSSVERIADIIHTEDSRRLKDSLKEYLKDADPEVRRRAAIAVGRIGGKGSAEILYPILKDKAIDVAAAAAFAIGQTGDKEYAAKLIDAAFDVPARVGEMALNSAGRLIDSTNTEEIDNITTLFTHPAPEVRKAVCMALFRANAKDRANDLINFINSEKSDEVKATALYTLSRMGIKEAFPVYESYLTDGDPDIRSLAVRGIGLSDNKDAVRYLLMALNDGNPRVAAQAILSLTKKDDESVSSNLAKKLNQTNDEKLTVDLFNALAARESSDAVITAMQMLDDEPSPNVSAAIVKYLAAAQKDKTVVIIDSLAKDDNPFLRTAAADAYGTINDAKIIPRLAMLFNDPDVSVRANAFNHLTTIDSGNVEYYIDKALEDSAYIPVVLAIDQIKTLKLSKYLPRLNELSQSVTPIVFDIRRTLLDCAGGFLENNPEDSIARIILRKSLSDKDYIIRKESAELLKTLYDEDLTDLVAPAKTRISKRQLAKALNKYKSNPKAKFITTQGEIEIELFFDVAPLTVLNFIELSEDEFYEGVKFHRVISNFVAQGGDPEGTGWGGAGYNIRCEYSPTPYERGTVGIATSGKDTGSSQFFFAHSPLPHLNGRYTVFGQVVSGMEVVDKLVIGDIIEEIIILEGNR